MPARLKSPMSPAPPLRGGALARSLIGSRVPSPLVEAEGDGGFVADR